MLCDRINAISSEGFRKLSSTCWKCHAGQSLSGGSAVVIIELFVNRLRLAECWICMTNSFLVAAGGWMHRVAMGVGGWRW